MNQTALDWNNKTAVVTGGASGIGRVIVEKCLTLGMNVVLADINKDDMDRVMNELQVDKTRLATVQTDVTKFESVELLSDIAYKTFGRVDILFNNAGVADNSFIWESSLKDWEWVLGVNLMGVVHGVKAFTPRMLAQDSNCFIVNTSSLSGLMSANLGIYSISKHAVVALSETLQQSLNMLHSKIKVGVFCPGFLKTKINVSERNRPGKYLNTENDDKNKEMRPELLKIKSFVDKAIENGMDPKEAVEILFKQLEEGKFYLQTHTDEKTMQSIKLRMEGILDGYLKV